MSRSAHIWNLYLRSPGCQAKATLRKSRDVCIFRRKENACSGMTGISSSGSQTALGDALSRSLSQAEDPGRPLGSLVVFSDGRNNTGRNLLEVGNEFRAQGIPINVIGVGKDRPQGDLKVTFSDRKPRAVAKEDLLLKAKVTNEFSKEVSTCSLFMGDEKLGNHP